MSRNFLVVLATLGSAAVLGGAFFFQYGMGLLPCQLCLWQRWPHGAAVLAGVLALVTRWRLWPWVGALATLTTAGIGVFHVGVEQRWWEGLATCTVDALSGVGRDDLLNLDVTVGGPVACDVIPWEMWGISMAGWNVIVSLGLTLVWVIAATRKR
ncbi:disulfide bond formation protein B [Neotabrizicola shimadae]|uniref:Disulfide bond formation protein B n=1 Tax=Neotabrizicola shimadae TaxID=2807096 RepID=A0A8G0ZUH5_9RHOB|nr:disulfide bond formation protein B [Neotabrizicola shimadae]QYZ71611.1 disulfide bond formation protein B [Neotabrizicola shimadae]